MGTRSPRAVSTGDRRQAGARRAGRMAPDDQQFVPADDQVRSRRPRSHQLRRAAGLARPQDRAFRRTGTALGEKLARATKAGPTRPHPAHATQPGGAEGPRARASRCLAGGTAAPLARLHSAPLAAALIVSGAG